MPQGISSFSAVINKTLNLWCTVKSIKVLYAFSCTIVIRILWKRDGLEELSNYFCHYGNSYVPIFYLLSFLKLDAIDAFPLF